MVVSAGLDVNYWRGLQPVEGAKLGSIPAGSYAVRGRISFDEHAVCGDASSTGRFLLDRALKIVPEGPAAEQKYWLRLRTEQGRENEHLLLRLIGGQVQGLEAVVGFAVQGSLWAKPDVCYLRVPGVFEALVMNREVTFIRKP